MIFCIAISCVRARDVCRCLVIQSEFFTAIDYILTYLHKKCDFQKLSSDFDKLPTDSNFNFENTEQYIDQLNAIKEIESQLRFYKKFLLSQPDVKERLQKKKSTN